MSGLTKPGGGNKPQPYIPAGNGDQSGQYTSLDRKTNMPKIKESLGKHNFCNSKLVGTVENHSTYIDRKTVPLIHIPNSVIKKIVDDFVVSERYYNDKGEPYLDIDYTCHGNPYTHPVVPHIHRWTKNKEGKFSRGKWEEFL